MLKLSKFANEGEQYEEIIFTQEDRSGFLYAVSLLENNQIKLGFTPNSQGGHYYIHNEELTTQIQRLLENGNLTKNDQ
ncbi:hypothetical protein AB9M62_49075 [Bacillales bacterium AN1005]